MPRVVKNSKYGCSRLRIHARGGSFWCGASPIVTPSISCRGCRNEVYSKKEEEWR